MQNKKKAQILHTTKNMGKHDVTYKLNFDMEAAKLSNHQQSVQNPPNNVKPMTIQHHHELSDNQATPSNFSNQAKSQYTNQTYSQNETGYLQNLIKEYEKSQK